MGNHIVSKKRVSVNEKRVISLNFLDGSFLSSLPVCLSLSVSHTYTHTLTHTETRTHTHLKHAQKDIHTGILDELTVYSPIGQA